MTLARAGERALDMALDLWHENIHDPKASDTRAAAMADRAKIDAMIRGPKGLGWTWRDPYPGDGDFEWCGAFAAFCWAWGAGLQMEHRLHWWSSNYRLNRWASYSKLGISAKDPPNPRPPAGIPPRLWIKIGLTWTAPDLAALGIIPRAGDILLVGTKEGFGRHVTLVESYSGGVFWTVSGNGVGKFPDGSKGQGVVRRSYRLGVETRRLIRPSMADLVPPVRRLVPGGQRL